jgi:hypothetical protein
VVNEIAKQVDMKDGLIARAPIIQPQAQPGPQKAAQPVSRLKTRPKQELTAGTQTIKQPLPQDIFHFKAAPLPQPPALANGFPFLSNATTAQQPSALPVDPPKMLFAISLQLSFQAAPMESPGSQPSAEEKEEKQINQWLKEMDPAGRLAVTEWLKKICSTYAPAMGRPCEINYSEMPPCGEADGWEHDLYEFVEGEHKRSTTRTRGREIATPRRRRTPGPRV